MNIGFLIITYGNNYLLSNCINSIRKFYNIPIYIIDNNINSIDCAEYYKLNYVSVHYVKNIENNFELGAIWYASKIFSYVDKFIILHNSMVILDKLPIDLESCHFMSFWKSSAADYSPTVCWVENKLQDVGIDMEYNKPWYSITGCCCIINTIYLKKLISYGYDKLYATNKFNAVGTEILFGYLISNVLGIFNNSLFECTLDDNVSGRINYKYIKKTAGGQGTNDQTIQTINLSNCRIFDKIFSINFKNKNDLNLCYIDVLNEIDKDENTSIQTFLLNSKNVYLTTPNSSFSVIYSIRHRLFTKKFFPTYYETEKQEILAGIKKLF